MSPARTPATAAGPPGISSVTTAPLNPSGSPSFWRSVLEIGPASIPNVPPTQVEADSIFFPAEEGGGPEEAQLSENVAAQTTIDLRNPLGIRLNGEASNRPVSMTSRLSPAPAGNRRRWSSSSSV